MIYIPWHEVEGVLRDGLAAHVVRAYGSKLDAYILPQPGGRYSFGIRYGARGEQYLSPPIGTETGARLHAQYGGKK